MSVYDMHVCLLSCLPMACLYDMPIYVVPAEDNCVENFDNTATNNLKLLSQQTCPCDSEHMFSCPRGGDTVSSKAGAAEAEGQGALDKVLGDLAEMGVSLRDTV